MNLEKKKGKQTKNRVLIGVISLVMIAGVAVGVYFGIRHNNNNNNNNNNKNNSSGNVNSGGTSPSPTPAPGLHNGTMINGTVLPYYTLTGPKPAPATLAGHVYTNCVVPGTYSISYDDGPSRFTSQLLDILDREQVKVTFFINGANVGCIYDPSVRDGIKRAYNSGHQIASHTWSHADLATLTVEQITTEMRRVEQALKDILGVVPRYMRPPYGSGTFANTGAVANARVQSTLGSLGYVIATWDIETLDAGADDHLTPHALSDAELLRREQGNVTSVVNATPKGANHMQLMHDTFERTVTNLTPWSITYIKGLGYKPVTVAECLGDSDPRNWYQSFQPPATTPPITCATP
ncbi:Carbohydrate esterase 4 protein [Mortierella sp. GBA30]|nr:Carbohydrate esterase 4 protein [Mortierella sp. GBA30]